MKEELYDIEGMHCAACSAAIERVTKKLDGVELSEVNLIMNRLRIVYDEAQTNSEEIIKKIERAGFAAKLKENKDAKSTNPKPQAEIKQGENAGDTGESIKKMKLGLIFQLGFSGALMLVSMGQMFFPNAPYPDIISVNTHPVNFAMLQLLLTIPVLYIGKKFFTGGIKSLLLLNPNMDSLVALSAGSSFIYSLVLTFMISDNPHLAHSLYYESAAMVVALVSVGKYMESSSKEKTKDAIKRLISLSPDTALLVEEKTADKFETREIPSAQLKVGDVVLVKSGMRVPADSVVIKGSGNVNEAMISGESLPVEKQLGSELIGGSTSAGGTLFAKVIRVGEESTLAKIVKFVEESQSKKAPISRTADKVAGVFVPIVIAISSITALIWLAFGATLPFALNAFTSVLVIACPCALGLATPTAIIVASGEAASNGILVRGAETLEVCHKADVCILDKTGTITEGRPVVSDVISENEELLMSTAYSLEQLSEHPIAKAICSRAKEISSLQVETYEDYTELSGKGIRAVSTAKSEILIGKPSFLREVNIDIAAYKERIDEFQSQGKTCVLAAKDGKALGLIAISDKIKQSSKAAIGALKDMKLKTVMLTGDNSAAASHIAAELGVDEVLAEVLPTEKAEQIERYQNAGHTVLMVGDGINDAPALMQANVGIAIGSGSDIAVDSADVVLIKDDLMDVARLISLGKHTIKNIKQNLFWAFFYNVLAIPLAAGLLYPIWSILLSPMIGAIAMSMSSLFVVANALRLRGKM